jgi:uncharacterized membrane protein
MTLFFGAPAFLALAPAVLFCAVVWRKRAGAFAALTGALLLLLGVLALSRPYLALPQKAASRAGPETVFVIKDLSGDGAASRAEEMARQVEDWLAREKPPRYRVLEARQSAWRTVQLANASLPPHLARRFVIFTGTALTAEESDGCREFARRCPWPVEFRTVSVRPAGDVSIERIALSADHLRLGDTLTADIDITGESSDCLLDVSVDGQPTAFDAPVVGESCVTWRIVHKTTKAGRGILTARIIREGDPKPENDSLSASFVVGDPPAVLVTSQDPEDARYLVAALKKDSFSVDHVTPADFPADSRQLQGYDGLVLYDVPAVFGQAQCAAMGEFVENQGGGLVFVAGPRAFSIGAYSGTPVERLLPVSPDIPKQAEKHKVALVLVLDASGSMAEPVGERYKLALVKDAAFAAAELLKPDLDEFGVVAFAGEADWVAPLATLADLQAVRTLLGRLQPGGETRLLPALVKAQLALKDSPADIRHVLVMSDGRTAGETDAFLRLAGQLPGDGITASCVAVGSDANRALLKAIAERGAGQFYSVESVTELPQVFTQDIQRHARSGLIEEPALPVLAQETLYSAAFFAEAPPLLGRLAARAKPDATVVLKTEDGLPLLAYGQRGAGRAVFFASDAGDRYARLWIDRWKSFAAFWAQAARFAIRQHVPPVTCRYAEGVPGAGILVTVSDSGALSEVASVQFSGPELDLTLPGRSVLPVFPEGFWLPLSQNLRQGHYLIQVVCPSQTRTAVCDVPSAGVCGNGFKWTRWTRWTKASSEGQRGNGSAPIGSAGSPSGQPVPPRVIPLSSPLLCLAALVLILDAFAKAGQVSKPPMAGR